MQKLQNMKIRIKDSEHSKQVQECLFKLGFGWGYSLAKTPVNTSSPFLYANTRDNTVTWSGTYGYWRNHPNKEVTLEDLQAMLAETDEDDMGFFCQDYDTENTGTGESPEDDSIPTFSVDNTINTLMSQIQKQLADVNMAVAIYEDTLEVVDMENDYRAFVDNWDGVLEAIKVKQAYLEVFKGD